MQFFLLMYLSPKTGLKFILGPVWLLALRLEVRFEENKIERHINQDSTAVKNVILQAK